MLMLTGGVASTNLYFYCFHCCNFVFWARISANKDWQLIMVWRTQLGVCSSFHVQTLVSNICHQQYLVLVYTTQVNSTFRARWLASLEVISQVLFTSEQPKENKMAFVATCIFSQIKLPFGLLVIQRVWYILKQLFTSVSVKVVDIYLHFGE